MSVLPILNYHGVLSKAANYKWHASEKVYAVDLTTIKEQLSALNKLDYQAMSLSDALEWLENDCAEKKFIVTFDDGHISQFEQAYPYLQSNNIKATFFIPTDFIGRKGQMSWDHLRILNKHGHEIGSHGASHIPLTSLSDHQLYHELNDSKKILEENLHIKINALSIPRGFYSKKVRLAAQQIGYQTICTSRYDINLKTQDPLSLRRISVKRITSIKAFCNAVKGELGIVRHLEFAKDCTRSLAGPNIYDSLARIKLGLIQHISSHKNGERMALDS